MPPIKPTDFRRTSSAMSGDDENPEKVAQYDVTPTLLKRIHQLLALTFSSTIILLVAVLLTFFLAPDNNKAALVGDGGLLMDTTEYGGDLRGEAYPPIETLPVMDDEQLKRVKTLQVTLPSEDGEGHVEIINVGGIEKLNNTCAVAYATISGVSITICNGVAFMDANGKRTKIIQKEYPVVLEEDDDISLAEDDYETPRSPEMKGLLMAYIQALEDINITAPFLVQVGNESDPVSLIEDDEEALLADGEDVEESGTRRRLYGSKYYTGGLHWDSESEGMGKVDKFQWARPGERAGINFPTDQIERSLIHGLRWGKVKKLPAIHADASICIGAVYEWQTAEVVVQAADIAEDAHRKYNRILPRDISQAIRGDKYLAKAFFKLMLNLKDRHKKPCPHTKEFYGPAIYEVVEEVFPHAGVTKEAMCWLNYFVDDTYDKLMRFLVNQAKKKCKKKWCTLTAKDVVNALLWGKILPDRMAKQAIEECEEAVNKFWKNSKGMHRPSNAARKVRIKKHGGKKG
jgi:histone H3/H4